MPGGPIIPGYIPGGIFGSKPGGPIIPGGKAGGGMPCGDPIIPGS